MELLDNISVQAQGISKTVELWRGDLTDIPVAEAVDVLVVSAFPDHYAPTTGSLIGALDRRGLSVAKLAEDKEEDLRKSFGCWMSRELGQLAPGLEFHRILCFEPYTKGRPTEVVGDIFRSLAPFLVGDQAIETVAMPLVACGSIGEQPEAILPPLVHAAVKWMKLGLPLRRLKIVVRTSTNVALVAEQFAALKRELQPPSPAEPTTRPTAPATSPPTSATQRDYDLFISYCWANSDVVHPFVEDLKRARPGVMVFLDRQELDPGVSWQAKIFDALDRCRKVVSFYSPDYLNSKMCQEEYNIARLRDREEGNVLFPIYVRSTNLPASWRTVNYLDCREADPGKLQKAVDALSLSL